MQISPRDRTLTLIGILLALFLGALDQTIVATALPRIAQDLSGLSRYSWVATAYLLSTTVLVPIYGKLADMFSRKHLELFVVSSFLIGSALCGLAGEFGTLPILGDGMSQLIIFRALQGIGGAGLFSLAFIIIADLFPPSERGKYQGIVGATFGFASVLGPWLGGLLTDHAGAWIPGIAGWRWVFYVNVPVGLLALWFIARRMPLLAPHDQSQKLDLLTALLLIATLVPVVLALQLDKTDYPWGSAVILGLFAFGAVMLLFFVVRSRRPSAPVIDLDLFHNRVFTTANLALLFLGGGFLGLVIFLPLYMVNVVGVSATGAGLSLIPLSIGMAVSSALAGQLVSRFGHYRLIMLVGAAILLVAVVLFSMMTTATTATQVAIYMVIAGLGLGPSLPLYTLAIQNAVDPRRVGQATSASQFFRQIGGTVASALLGAVLSANLVASFAALPLPDIPGAAAFTGANGGRLANTDLSDIRQGVIGSFDSYYQQLVSAVQAGNVEAARALVEQLPAPARAKAAISAEAAAAAEAVASAGDSAAGGVIPTPAPGNASGGATSAPVGGTSPTLALEAKLPAEAGRFLAAFKATLDENAAAVADSVVNAVRSAFNDAITGIYVYLIAIVALGAVITFFIPVLELRKTNDSVAAA